MKENKLISLLRTLKKEEFRQMARFVQSPIHNRHEGVIRLFAYLRRYIEGEKGPIKQEKLMKHLFPENTAGIQELHYLNSYLLKVLEEFLAWSEWKREESDWGLYLLRAYRKRGLEKPFFQNLRKAGHQQQKQSLRNATYFRQEYQLELEKHNYLVEHGRQKGMHLQELSQTLDLAFFAEKLKNACILLSHQAVSKAQYNMGILEPVLAYVEQNELLDNPAIAISYYSYRALADTEDEGSFQALKAQLVDNRDCFTIHELQDSHLLAINCCIRRLNQRKPGYLREVFDLYRSGLELRCFLSRGQLSPRTYSNITVSGLKLEEYDWVYQFIHEHRDSLPENQREGFFSFNLARFYYELGDYQQAMPLLMQMETDDLIDNLSAKTMLSKMYFELQELDALDSLLNSFRTYIYRKELGYHRDSYLAFIGLMYKLMAIKPYDDKAKEKLRSEISSSRTPEKDWLLKQLKI